MTSRRSEVAPPAPLSAVQGSAPVDFETIVKRSIGDAAAWRQLVKSPENLEPTYWALRKWKDDLKSQRRIKESRVQAGEADGREHHRWLMRQATFERYVDMRLRELPTFHKPTIGPPPKPGTATALRARVSEWRTAAAVIVAGVLAVEDGTASIEELSSLLDAHNVHMGKFGRLSLREAAPYITGALDREHGNEGN